MDQADLSFNACVTPVSEAPRDKIRKPVPVHIPHNAQGIAETPVRGRARQFDVFAVQGRTAEQEDHPALLVHAPERCSNGDIRVSVCVHIAHRGDGSAQLLPFESSLRSPRGIRQQGSPVGRRGCGKAGWKGLGRLLRFRNCRRLK